MSDQKATNDNKHRAPEQQVKVVAEMPEDEQVREQMEDRKETDGYSGSCGF